MYTNHEEFVLCIWLELCITFCSKEIFIFACISLHIDMQTFLVKLLYWRKCSGFCWRFHNNGVQSFQRIENLANKKPGPLPWNDFWTKKKKKLNEFASKPFQWWRRLARSHKHFCFFFLFFAPIQTNLFEYVHIYGEHIFHRFILPSCSVVSIKIKYRLHHKIFVTHTYFSCIFFYCKMCLLSRFVPMFMENLDKNFGASMRFLIHLFIWL